MNLGAPRARMLIGPEGLCRWRSNGHLGKQHSSVTLELRCQSALRAHVRASTLHAQGILPPCIWPLRRHLRFLNRLHYLNTRTGS